MKNLTIQCSWYDIYKNVEKSDMLGMGILDYVILSETIPYDNDGIRYIYELNDDKKAMIDLLEVIHTLYGMIDVKNVVKVLKMVTEKKIKII